MKNAAWSAAHASLRGAKRLWFSKANLTSSVPANLSKYEGDTMNPSNDRWCMVRHMSAHVHRGASVNPGKPFSDRVRHDWAMPVKRCPEQGVFSCFGWGAAPGVGTGVNRYEPQGQLGCPSNSKGVDVPRPTLTSVGSNKHKLG